VTIEQFRARVNKGDGCWLWGGGLDGHGYGALRFGNRFRHAHHVAWEDAFGAIPEGKQVLHQCDTPACVRPSHLFLGTHQENMADKVAKKRHAFGERVRSAKLSTADVVTIRTRLKLGERNIDLAREYSVDPSEISHIKRGVHWKEACHQPISQ
jgi:hypothetical protein